MTIMQIHGFNTRQANGRNGPFTIYEVNLNGQPYVARRPLYEQAMSFGVGATVDVDTRTEQNGQWTNYYLDDLRPQQWQQSNPAPQPPSQPAYSASQPAVQAQPPAPVAPSDKDRQIWRQTATKVAAWLSEGGAGSFWENVDKLMWFYETGQHPQPMSQQQPSLPSYSGQPVPDDYSEDIPF